MQAVADRIDTRDYILGPQPSNRPMTISLDTRRKRLLFQSRHRGMQETDLMIGGFAERHLADLDDTQLDRFEALLAEGDNDLFNWMSGKEPVPAAHDHDVMAMILKFNNRSE